MENEELLNLAATFATTAKKMLEGKDLEYKKVTVEVSIPQYLVSTSESLALFLKITPEEVLAHIVEGCIEDGLSKSKELAVSEAANPSTKTSVEQATESLGEIKELFGALGMDMSQFTDSFKKLDTLVVQLNGLQEATEQAYGKGTTTNTKNTTKPKLPDGRVTREGGKLPR